MKKIFLTLFNFQKILNISDIKYINVILIIDGELYKKIIKKILIDWVYQCKSQKKKNIKKIIFLKNLFFWAAKMFY